MSNHICVPMPNSIGAYELGVMSSKMTDAVRQLEQEILNSPQTEIVTQHVLHAGMYARTIMIPSGVVLTGALIKIPTLLIVNGDVMIYRDDGPVRISGHNVMLGAAGRKQAFVAVSDTYLTMIFPTDAKTVSTAEAEFTDDYARLMSRADGAANHIVMGE